MKKLLTILALSLCATVVFAATDTTTYVRNGNNFTKVQKVQDSSDIQTTYTYTIKDVAYPIWITKNGRCYIVRVSKKGNEYKQYLEENIAKQICNEMNIEYKVSKS